MAPVLGWLRDRFAAPYSPPDWHYTTREDLQSDLQDRLAGGGVTHYVDAKTKGYLDQCERAIKEARRAAPDGAGNQWTDVINSDGRAYARVTKTRQMPTGSTKQRAQAAHIAGGANCDEFGALSMAALLAEGVKGKPVIRAHTRGVKHEYCVIGDPRESNDVVVADAWATRPQALTWKDFTFAGSSSQFCADHVYNDSRPNPEYDFSDIVPASMTTAQARAMYNVPPGQSLVDWIRASRSRRKLMWEQDFSSTTDGWIHYRVG